MQTIWTFLTQSWKDILPSVVGSFALVIYILQCRNEKNNAASVLILQIDELLDKIREMSSYIVEGQLNNTAFYESLPLFEENCWNKYKHLFVKDMAATDYSALNHFYNYAVKIQEQQQLMKNLQKNSFFQTQGSYTQLEVQNIFQDLSRLDTLPNAQSISKAVGETIPPNVSDDDKKTLNALLQQLLTINPQFDMSQFWTMYNRHREQIHNIINQGALTTYIPKQIGLSLEKAIQETTMLGISGTEGYRILKKFSKRKW